MSRARNTSRRRKKSGARRTSPIIVKRRSSGRSRRAAFFTVSKVLAILGFLVACYTVYYTYVRNQRADNLEARELTEEAVDLLGGREGTIWVDDPYLPTQARLSKLEIANRKADRALELDHGNLRALNIKGLHHFHRGEISRARFYLQEAIKAEPDSASSNSNYAAVLEANSDLDGAQYYYEKAIDISPHHSGAHIGLGWVLVKKKQLDQAEKHFRRAIEIEPFNSFAYASYGILSDLQGKEDLAFEHLEKAIDLDPTVARAHHSLAIVLLKRGEVDAAIRHLETAVDLQPAHKIFAKKLDMIRSVTSEPSRESVLVNTLGDVLGASEEQKKQILWKMLLADVPATILPNPVLEESVQ